MGQFFKQYLEPIKLNDVHVDWKSMDLSYLLEENYIRHFANIVSNAKPVHGTDVVLKAYNIDGDVRIQYKAQADFERIAHKFGIFDEWKTAQMKSGISPFVHQIIEAPLNFSSNKRDTLVNMSRCLDSISGDLSNTS
ncbi:hypothetical protein HHK36_010469 [Tetracentron sinense]|uniref:Alpha-1,3-mannosyl-glycoprotein 2-beta-N-acetylglucosaminyltransferase n=1 Tax=Tetracentron sinense TaxID=13715 RepID=A0A834ZNK2_TETSI|nr:hypothetical protein HHK36_010469 [Tetracentron sinense]